jgi:hypothetical protein
MSGEDDDETPDWTVLLMEALGDLNLDGLTTEQIRDLINQKLKEHGIDDVEIADIKIAH